MKVNWKKLLVALAIPLGIGGLSALAAGSFSDSYQALRQPPLAPPGWVFPIVWSILYLLMGYASYRIWVSSASTSEKRLALGIYLAQLVLNFLWSPLFFRWELRLTAFLVLLALWATVMLTIYFFTRIDETAGDLLLPYILWVTFAAYLNLAVFFLN